MLVDSAVSRATDVDKSSDHEDKDQAQENYVVCITAHDFPLRLYR